MNAIKRFISVFLLMVISHGAWALSGGFESANPDTIMQFIQGNNALIYLSTFFGVGILLAFTPCVLPMVPILSGIIVGEKNLSSRLGLKLSLSYVAGMSLTYAICGILAGFLGSTVQTIMQKPSIIIAFSLLFVVMALAMFDLFELRLPLAISSRLQGLNQKQKRGKHLSVALMGVASTLIVSPCITAPLIGVLSFIGQTGQPLLGGLILFVMALGMGMPLIIVGAGYGSILPKTGPWMITIKKLFGLMMLGMAIWMSARVLPQSVSHLLWAALLLIGSVYMGTLNASKNKRDKLFQCLGILAMITGGIICFNTSLLLIKPNISPLEKVSSNSFTLIHSREAIQKELEKARAQKKPVFMDFTASWCSDCQNLDTKVLNHPEIVNAMNGLVNLKIDISDNSEETSQIKREFAIYGTPTLLFFNAKGHSLKKLSAVGFIEKDALLGLLVEANRRVN